MKSKSQNSIIIKALVLLACFLIPIIVFAIKLNSFELKVMDESFRKAWSGQMASYINSETIGIIVNNLIVGFIMYLFTVIPFFIFEKSKKKRDYKTLFNFIKIAYILYFIKEGVRISIILSDLTYKSFLFEFFVLVFPHGIIELLGLALVASSTFHYITNEINIKTLYKYLLLSVVLIILAGVLETTLTPYLFRKLL